MSTKSEQKLTYKTFLTKSVSTSCDKSGKCARFSGANSCSKDAPYSKCPKYANCGKDHVRFSFKCPVLQKLMKSKK